MFRKCKTAEEIKTLFRRLSKFLHPDVGGDVDLMTLLNECYREQLDQIQSIGKPKKVKRTPSPKDSFSPVRESRVLYEDPRSDMIIYIMGYMQRNPEFKSEFLQSIVDFFSRKKYVTGKQYNAALNIYYMYAMEEEDHEL